MPIQVDEKFGSRSGDGVTSQERLYSVKGTPDEVQALNAAYAVVPLYVGMLRRRPPVIEQVGEDLWEVRVQYSILDDVFTFDTSGGSQHITQSLETLGRYPATGAPDFQGAIGVSRDSVDGTDITVPVFQFSVTKVEPTESVPGTYVQTLYGLTGRTNNNTYTLTVDNVVMTFERGELLFLGASGNKRIREHWEFSYRFAASPNATGISLGGIAGITKRGWDYLWVRYADEEDSAAVAIVKRPVAVYVERVYEEADFTQLRI